MQSLSAVVRQSCEELMLPVKPAFHLKEERVAVERAPELQQINSECRFWPFPQQQRVGVTPAGCSMHMQPACPRPKPVKPDSATVVDVGSGSSTLSPPVTLSALCLTQKHLSKQALIYDSSERCNLRFSGTRRGGKKQKEEVGVSGLSNQL